mmetsp:Transcript_8471/g.31289  ORF Transcript_8471/g.31289 Transcript_8471/m.31289 type:complete len:216 (+) Transcript_8471:2692-3339(+)
MMSLSRCAARCSSSLPYCMRSASTTCWRPAIQVQASQHSVRSQAPAGARAATNTWTRRAQVLKRALLALRSNASLLAGRTPAMASSVKTTNAPKAKWEPAVLVMAVCRQRRCSATFWTALSAPTHPVWTPMAQSSVTSFLRRSSAVSQRELAAPAMSVCRSRLQIAKSSKASSRPTSLAWTLQASRYVPRFRSMSLIARHRRYRRRRPRQICSSV